MTVRVDSSGTHLRDNPGPWWLLALLFLSVGAALTFIGLFRSGDVPGWQAWLGTLMGVAATGVGAVWAWRSPGSQVSFDSRTGQLTLSRFGLFGYRRRSFRLDQIERVEVQHSHDDENNLVARPLLVLRDGRSVALSELWHHDVGGVERATVAFGAAIDKRPD